MIHLNKISKSFWTPTGQKVILHETDFIFPKGVSVGLLGRNGAGKSTLFNLISGRFGVSSGDIRLNGSSIVGLRPFEINRRGLSRSFQITNIFPKLSVFENLRCSLLWSMGYRYNFWCALSGLGDVNQRAQDLLDRLGLSARRDVLAMNLTYAEQRSLEVGITIGGGANVVLLDEPTAGMSHEETTHFIRMIRTVTQGKTLLTVEHDMGVVFELADRIAVVVYGEVIAFDTPANVKNNPRVQEAYLGAVLQAQDHDDTNGPSNAQHVPQGQAAGGHSQP